MMLSRRGAIGGGVATLSVAALSGPSVHAMTVSGTRLEVSLANEGNQILSHAADLGLVQFRVRELGSNVSVIDFANIVLSGLGPAAPIRTTALARRSASFLSRVVAASKDEGSLGAKAATRAIYPFGSLRKEYNRDFNACIVKPQHSAEIRKVAAFIAQNEVRSRYQEIEAVTGVPWYVTGAIHYREAGSNFLGHLHNGDPLQTKTTHVPKQRPLGVWPPSPWDARAAFRKSAVDALKEFSGVKKWTVERMLYTFEAYNGFGYRIHRINTPYLWSFSNLYEKGGFPCDKCFDPNWVSKQAGVGLIIRAAADSDPQEVQLAFELNR